MTSTVAVRGRPLATLLRQLLTDSPAASEGPVAVTAAAAAPASTTARRTYKVQGAGPLRRDGNESSDSDDDDDEYEHVAPADTRRRARARARDVTAPYYFSSSDVVDPFGAPTSMGRLLAPLMEDKAAPGTTGFSTTAPRRGWWVTKEDDGAVHIKVSMPGLGKEHVKVCAEQNILVVKGEGEKDPEEDAAPLRYICRINLPADAFKMDKIKAEMKNGVLRVTVPKLKEEERKDVFQIKVE